MKKKLSKPIPGAPSVLARRPVLTARPWSAAHMAALAEINAADLARARRAWAKHAPARAKGLLNARARRG